MTRAAKCLTISRDVIRSVTMAHRLPAAMLVAVVLAGSPVTGAARPAGPAVPGTQEWARGYNGPANGPDSPAALAVSPAGDLVFVTGYSAGAGTGWDYATVAYRAGTGAQVWARRYSGPGSRPDEAAAVAVSPGGNRVFVTGSSRGATSLNDYATVAYDARTGAQVWLRRYNDPSDSMDTGSSVAASPDGQTVLVTGQSFNIKAGGYDCATIAYRAATGARMWLRRDKEPANTDNLACRLVVGPGGQTSYVIGAGGSWYTITAYATATGRQLWERRYGRSGGHGTNEQATAMTVSPSGAKLYVTGSTWRPAAPSGDYVTVAYNAANGARLWGRQYNGTGNSTDSATAIDTSPSGGTVYVTGSSIGTGDQGDDYATVAYNAATGARRWVARYDGPVGRGGVPRSLSVNPRSGTIYITGTVAGGYKSALDYGTVAYSASTGAQLWTALYTGPGARNDWPCCLGVSPAGGTIFVTGSSNRQGEQTNYATIAYRG